MKKACADFVGIAAPVNLARDGACDAPDDVGVGGCLAAVLYLAVAKWEIGSLIWLPKPMAIDSVPMLLCCGGGGGHMEVCKLSELGVRRHIVEAWVVVGPALVASSKADMRRGKPGYVRIPQVHTTRIKT